MTSGPRRAVFLDRDGVVNRSVMRNGKPYPPASLTELEIMPDAPEALADLKTRGFLLVIATNQPDVGRGTQQRTTVEAINAALRSTLPLDDFFVCYHDSVDDCDCRKPLPGLLLQAAAKHSIDLSSSFMIGDRWRDIEAGSSAGCRTILIDYGYSEQNPRHPPNAQVSSLRAAVDWILEHCRLPRSIR
jgi:D-glycero-D-manno-heptose 1,7-bisphosphate phosphatase